MSNYFIAKRLSKKGPFSLEQVKKQKIYPTTKIWKEGLSDWVEASEIEELKSFIQILPPSRLKPFYGSYFKLKIKHTLVILLVSLIIYIGISPSFVYSLYVKVAYSQELNETNLRTLDKSISKTFFGERLFYLLLIFFALYLGASILKGLGMYYKKHKQNNPF